MKTFLIISILSFSIFSSFSFAETGFNQKLNLKYNLGLMVNNETYQVYRSMKLGKPGLMVTFQELKNRGLAQPKTIISMNDEGYGEFWGGGNYALEEYLNQDNFGYKYYHAFDKPEFRTYLDGDDPRYPQEDIDVKGKLKNYEAKKLFGANSSEGIGKKDGGLDIFYRILDIILDEQNQPVLFHCHGGRHRTGIIAMALRYIQGEGTDLSNENVYVDGIPALSDIELEYNNFAPKIGGIFGGPRKENLYFMRWLITTDKFKSYVAKYQARLQ